MVDHLFSDFNLPGVPGASVMVIRKGVPVIETNYGLADLEKLTICATDTNYRLASVSKQFTSMCVLILIAQGKISLEDRLPKFFPEFPPYGKDITVRQLLSHRSGLPDYEDLIPKTATEQVHDHDVLLLLEAQKTPMFPAGTKFHYSNGGYACLALIVQKVSGQPYAHFLRDHIFQPLGMKNSVAYEKGVSTVTHRAFGYTADVTTDKTRRTFVPSDQSTTSAVLGDGGIYSSIVDMFKWDQALYTEKLIPKELLQQAWTPDSDTSDFQHSGYGFGWYVGTYRGVNSVWHYGSTCGFSTHIERYPSKKLSLIVLANRRNAPLADISRSLIDLYWE